MELPGNVERDLAGKGLSVGTGVEFIMWFYIYMYRDFINRNRASSQTASIIVIIWWLQPPIILKKASFLDLLCWSSFKKMRLTLKAAYSVSCWTGCWNICLVLLCSCCPQGQALWGAHGHMIWSASVESSYAYLGLKPRTFWETSLSLARLEGQAGSHVKRYEGGQTFKDEQGQV